MRPANESFSGRHIQPCGDMGVIEFANARTLGDFGDDQSERILRTVLFTDIVDSTHLELGRATSRDRTETVAMQDA